MAQHGRPQAEQSANPTDVPFTILALGSPHGDDRVAWHVADRLERDPRFAGTIHKIGSPWDVIDYFEPGCRVVILDACRSGAPAGTIVRRTGQTLRETPERAGSTHAGSLAQSLQMAQALGRNCNDILILAIEIESTANDREMSPPVLQAALELEKEVRSRLLQESAIA